MEKQKSEPITKAWYLVGAYGVCVFISVYHRQGDGHSIANQCYGYRVASNVRKRVYSRHLRAWEAIGGGGGGYRIDQATGTPQK